ncbi:MAG TPA: hypothetical protein P5277_03865 [Candidatus Paceibacterota bacterium]|nr:hypothetical protein [Candidatus Paceibacterota bacterium]
MERGRNKLFFEFLLISLLILSVFLLAININSNFVSAAIGDINPENTEDPLGTGINIEEVSEDPDLLQNKSRDYLKQEWTKIFEGNSFGRVILGVSNILEALSPLFKIVLGVEYSMSWSFVFATAIWLTLFLILFNPAGAIFGNKLFGFIGAFVIASLVGVSGVIKKSVDMLNFMITNKWIAWFSFFIALLIVFLGYAIGKVFSKNIEASKENAAKQKLKEDREIIGTHAEVSKVNLESYKK